MAYPKTPFVLRFLFALALMNLATGAFNQFTNAYFSKFMKFSVEQIGTISAAGQFTQVLAILVSPLIIRRLGVVYGVVVMETAAALALGLLAMGPRPLAAAIGYAGYMAFQWMDEPAMEALLMSRVAIEQRSGASAMMYLVIFATQAVVQPVAGAAYTTVGYPAVLGVASGLLLAGGLLFGLLLKKFEQA